MRMYLTRLIVLISFVLAACTPTPEIVLFQLSPQATVLGAKAIVSGRAAPGARVWVNAQELTATSGVYTAVVDLAWGSNPIVVAVELSGQRETRTLYVERYAADVDQIGDIYFSFAGIEQAATLGVSPLDETPSGIFSIVTLEVENRSAATIEMPTPNGFKLEDESGRLYAMSERGAFSHGWDTAPGYLPGRELAPGEIIQGWLVFDTAVTAKQFVLHARSNPTQGEWYARVAVSVQHKE